MAGLHFKFLAYKNGETSVIEFTKSKAPEDSEIVGIDNSAHETLRKAVACCDGEDSITLSLAAAMGLVMEWDKRPQSRASD